MHQGRPERPSPKATDEAKAQFRTLVPDDERVSLKPMFGAIAAFANGYMFMGLFANELFVRLDDADTAAVTAAGGGPLEPMPGKPMRGYVTIPNWSSDESAVREWGAKSLAYTLSMPPKNEIGVEQATVGRRETVSTGAGRPEPAASAR